MTTHVKVLAVLFLAFGAFGVLIALLMLLVFGGAAGIVGATTGGEPDAWIALPILGLTGGALALFFLVLSVPLVIVGMGLLKLRPWARIGGIVASALNLINIPFGTIVGVYGLWVLLSKEAERLFVERGPVFDGPPTLPPSP